MATTENLHIGDASKTKFSFTFPYLNQTDVEVYKYVTNAWVKQTITTHYTFDNATTIKFGSAPAAATSAEQAKLGNTKNIKIKRNTDTSELAATFYPGSAIRSVDLNDNYTQNLYVTQEAENDAATNTKAVDRIVATTNDDGATWILAGNDTNASTDPKGVGYAVTKATDADANATTALTNSRESDGSGGYNTAISVANAAKAQSTTAENTANSASAAVGGKLDKTGGEMSGNITMAGAQTVDGRDLSVDGSKLDGIEASADVTDATNVTAAGALMDSEVTNLAFVKALTKGISDGNVLTANDVVADNDFLKIDGTEVEGRTAAEVRSDLNVEDGATADQTDAEIRTAVLLDEDGFTSNSDTKAPSQQSTKAYITATSQPLDAELTTLAGMQSGTASILASGTALTSDTSELNLLDGKSIVTAVSGSSTNVQLPTAKAVNDQIVALLNDAGGFVPIADKDSFPETNPDPGNNAGTIVSIADAGGLVVDSSGVSTNGDTISTDATVTINGIDSTLRGTTIAAGKGMLVQTTTTLNIYDYHRLVVDEAGVAAAQTLVTDFNQRYQVASSAPSNQPDGTALVEGDLFFNTGSNTMMVYDGSDYAVVTSVGDYKLLTVVPDGATSGTPNYANTSFDLRDGSSAANITSAGQLLVSVNGVLQKPNAGSYSSSEEGFYVEGTNGIKFCTAPGTGASIFVTLIGSATTVNVPADNSVSTVKIQNGAVNEDRIANDAVTADKLANSINTAIAANTAKNTNVTTNLSVTANGTSLTVASSDGTDASIPAATTSAWGAMTDEDKTKLDGLVTNATHTGDVTGSTALTIANDAVDGAKLANNIDIAGTLDVTGAAVFDSTGTFAGNVQAGAAAAHGGSDTGVTIKSSGLVNATRATGSNLWAGFKTGDNTQTSQITSDGAATFAGDLSLSTDDKKLKLGASDDLEISHDGSHSYINNSTGNLYIRNNSDIIFYNKWDNEYYAQFHPNAGVDLYHNNVKKFETTSAGVTITGDLTVTGDAPGGGAWNLVSTINASSAATVEFTSVIDNTYKQWCIVATEVFTDASSATDIVMRYKSGSTVISAADYSYGIHFIHAGNDVVSVRASSANVMRLVGHTFSSNSNWGGQNFQIWMPGDVDSYGHRMYWFGGGGYWSNSATNTGTFSGGGGLVSNAGSTTQVDGLKIYHNSGSNLTGTFKLYGLS